MGNPHLKSNVRDQMRVRGNRVKGRSFAQIPQQNRVVVAARRHIVTAKRPYRNARKQTQKFRKVKFGNFTADERSSARDMIAFVGGVMYVC
jgi:hypothetical protein